MDEKGQDAVTHAEVSSFGLWLSEKRSKAAITVSELAKMAGVGPDAIRGIKSGNFQNPQSASRNKLAAALNETVPPPVVKEIEQDQCIVGLGSLIDFAV